MQRGRRINSETTIANKDRRLFMQRAGIGALATLLPGCLGSDNSNSPYPLVADGQARLADSQIQNAVAQLDFLAERIMQQSRIPGMAVAVVQGDALLYAKGFGLRRIGSPEKVDADTVFALASMSKAIGATAVARQISAGTLEWNTPIRNVLPNFTLADPTVSAQLTLGDLYAHRSGLPDHAGDTLEEMGYDQAYIFERLRQLPLGSFRQSFAYTNYGIVAAGMAAAARSGLDWATLCELVLYSPLGMTSTSSRSSDFLSRPNRAPGHVIENGAFTLGPERAPGTGQQRWSDVWRSDIASPAAGVSASANDIARWMSFVLGAINGQSTASRLLTPAAFAPAVNPQATITTATDPAQYYGYGFFIDVPVSGRIVLKHGGDLRWGAHTQFSLLPSANLGIVVLTNAWSTGVAPALTAEFLDLAQFGTTKDWFAEFGPLYNSIINASSGELAGKSPPPSPTPPKALEFYAGQYENPYYGSVSISLNGKGLELRTGPRGMTAYSLQHWDGDIFTFTPLNDSAAVGSVSKADFTGGQLILEHYNNDDEENGTRGLGVFTRVAT